MAVSVQPLRLAYNRIPVFRTKNCYSLVSGNLPVCKSQSDSNETIRFLRGYNCAPNEKVLAAPRELPGPEVKRLSSVSLLGYLTVSETGAVCCIFPLVAVTTIP